MKGTGRLIYGARPQCPVFPLVNLPQFVALVCCSFVSLLSLITVRPLGSTGLTARWPESKQTTKETGNRVKSWTMLTESRSRTDPLNRQTCPGAGGAMTTRQPR